MKFARGNNCLCNFFHLRQTQRLLQIDVHKYSPESRTKVEGSEYYIYLFINQFNTQNTSINYVDNITQSILNIYFIIVQIFVSFNGYALYHQYQILIQYNHVLPKPVSNCDFVPNWKNSKLIVIQDVTGLRNLMLSLCN